MKIVLLDETRDRFEAEHRWWREHRDAKEFFITEFDEVLRQVSAAPGSGPHYRRARGKLIQRVLMKKTRCHVYYFHDKEFHRSAGPASCGNPRLRQRPTFAKSRNPVPPSLRN